MSKHTGTQPEEVDEALEAAAQALEAGQPQEALELAKAALAHAPKLPEALHTLAVAHWELGDPEAAREAFERALREAPDEPGLLLDLVELLLEFNDEDHSVVDEALDWCRRGLALARREKDPELELEFLLLSAGAHGQKGDSPRSLEAIEQALEIAPKDPGALLERAMTLFELCRFEESATALQAVPLSDENRAWVEHYLGLLAERRGEARTADKHFAKATSLDPDHFPAPIKLSEKEFDGALSSALERLPAHAKKHLENTTVAVEPFPDVEDLITQSPPLSPLSLGLFRGTPIGERSLSSAADHFPTAIVLYQKNLERVARTREELIEQIEITVLHEVGHLLGLDEDGLWERGLD